MATEQRPGVPGTAPTRQELPELRRLLTEAPLKIHGRIVNASNHTMLAELEGGDGVLAVYKPRVGEGPLWDFSYGTLHLREVAAGVVSDYLGWELVPPTVLRDGPLGPGSVQLFIDHDPRRHFFVLIDEDVHDTALARMATFDVVVNNADRKGGHVLLAGDGHIWGCDHGLTFHVEDKLRTVIWDFGGMSLEPAWCEDLDRFVHDLSNAGGTLRRSLDELLTRDEVAALAARAAALRAVAVLPEVPEDGRPYPWPPV